eukprot:CAMPEP_0204613632 /NCGR_PEP_ID=MMETSP0717-20131115/1570_1 /ASSEMBLY_ACC=CAM_ASM_000666 /TAXON_ID=230516 /ORGANISM="Chaetoceros curvisetus" /LENGTH=114 /DNA_ID=CAMNT_0051626111 /DNA_START=1040 /DNA_END=1384 /DNA_ORIENTATION=+
MLGKDAAEADMTLIEASDTTVFPFRVLFFPRRLRVPGSMVPGQLGLVEHGGFASFRPTDNWGEDGLDNNEIASEGKPSILESEVLRVELVTVRDAVEIPLESRLLRPSLGLGSS